METIDDSILTALNTRSERMFLFSLEDEFKNVVNNAKSDECIMFPTLTSYHRLLIHKVAERYGLVSESSGWGNERQTSVATTSKLRIPCLTFKDFIIYEGKPPDKDKKQKLTETTTPDIASTSVPTEPKATDTPTNSTPTPKGDTKPDTPDSTPSVSATSVTTSDAPFAATVPVTSAASTTPVTAIPATPNTPNTPTTTLANSLAALATNLTSTPTRDKTPKSTPSSGPRVVRGRGSSKFSTRNEEKEYDSISEPMERTANEEGAAENDKSGTTEGPIDASESGLNMDEGTLPPMKQLPLLNDYSQYEYGATQKNSRANEAYGFAVYEHIVKISSEGSSVTKAQIESILSGLTRQRFTVKVDKDNTFYAIFRSVAAAEALLRLDTSRFPTGHNFSLLTTTSTPKKDELEDEVVYPRPATTSRVARRLIGNALEMAGLQRSVAQ